MASKAVVNEEAVAQSQAVDLKRMYRTMVRIRAFEEQVAALIEKDMIKTPCHLYIGQEAVATGVCDVLMDRDTIWGSHRSHGHYLAKGGSMDAMMAEILGKATGCSGGRGGSMHLVAPEIGIMGTVPIVAATVPLSVGAALASKLRGDATVSVAFFGDGCIEEGHVHESMNLAALNGLPVIFVCENNLYASHMRLSERRLLDNLSEAGNFHGIPSNTADGNDVMAVRAAAQEAVNRARNGEGPSFLEFRTFRWRGHVGASMDMDVGVKRRDELKDWLPRDPVAHSRRLLVEMETQENVLDEIDQAARAEAAAAVSFAERSEFPAPEDVLAYVFAGTTD